jgi:hypothetical protein
VPVSLVDDPRQFFPGQVGVAEPWAANRATPPLALVLPARRRDRAAARRRGRPRPPCRHGIPAIADLDVVPYAGFPLTDVHGPVLGSLCAVNHDPPAPGRGGLPDVVWPGSGVLRAPAADRGRRRAGRTASGGGPWRGQPCGVVHPGLNQAAARLSRLVVPSLADCSVVGLLEQATLALLTYVEDETDGFRLLVRESPVPLTDSDGYATITSDVDRPVEHILDREFASRGFRTTLAALYSQTLVGSVALVGQWWLDARELDRDDVAAHLVNLAWNGLSSLKTDPSLRLRA